MVCNAYWAVGLAAVLVGCVVPNSAPTPPPSFLAPAVTIHFINVSLGESIWVDTSQRDLLVDGGSRYNAPKLLAYLEAHNVTQLDVLSPSNHDEDHLGGLVSVLERLNISEVWDSGSTKTTQVFADYLDRAQVVPNFTFVARGDRFPLAPRVWVEVQNPLQPLEFSSENDNSVVLQLHVGAFTLLLAGDCEQACEDSILRTGNSIQSTFLKAGHHGSKTSTNEHFLDAVSPTAVFLLAGQQGYTRYGHPHSQTLRKLQARGIPYYTTRLNGTLILEIRQGCFTLRPQVGQTLSGCSP